jgi:hypothetical protein
MHWGFRIETLVIAAVLSAAAGCESTVSVGSACKDGVCPLSVGTDNCLARISERAVAFTGMAESDRSTPGICWPSNLQRNALGFVKARVHWILPLAAQASAGTPTHCTDLPFLHAINVAWDADYRQFYGREICDVDQLPVHDGTVSSGEGFFYDDFSSELHGRCIAGTPGFISLKNAPPSAGVIFRFVSDEMLGANGEPDTGRVCRAVGDSSYTGKRCMPPLESYDQSQAVLETRSPACGGGPCLVYHLEGSVSASCVPKPQIHPCARDEVGCTPPQPCASQEELAKFAFCSCRCDAPDPDAQLCPCHAGFACTPLIEDGDPALVGSYCVPKDITTGP